MELLTNLKNENASYVTNKLIHNKNYNEIIELLSDKKYKLFLGERNVYRLLALFTESDQPLIKYNFAAKKDYFINCTRKEFRFVMVSLIEDPSNLNCMCLIKIRQLFSKEEFEAKVNSIMLEDSHISFLNGVLLSNNL